MKVLIVFASKYGSTDGVAAAIAETLQERGHRAEARAAADAPAPDAFDAVVIGSGVYIGSWLKPAAGYLEAHAAALAQRPVWLFGVGPLGAENPQPAGDPEQASKLIELVGARGYVTFSGALDRSRLSLAERLIVRMVKAPDGDFRDWQAIRGWAHAIADGLATGVHDVAAGPTAHAVGTSAAAEGGRA